MIDLSCLSRHLACRLDRPTDQLLPVLQTSVAKDWFRLHGISGLKRVYGSVALSPGNERAVAVE